jgi:glycerate kinase
LETKTRSSFTGFVSYFAVRVVVAPDKFKGTLGAREVASAIARGCRRVRPEADIDLCPMADGGEGTVDALMAASGEAIERFEVTGPLGDRVVAPVARLEGGRSALEAAAAAGLVLVPSNRRRPLTASSLGVGELMRAAGPADPLIVGVGGTASSDGGTGAARALGWRFLDRLGRDLPPGGGELTRLAQISGDHAVTGLGAIVAACDVTNPLTGPAGAARVFAPQKGASEREVGQLEDALENLAARIATDLGIEVGHLSRGGAGGGLGAGLAVFAGAKLAEGAELVIGATRLRDRLESADLVITGEGRLDAQSLEGKVPIAVAAAARSAGVTCMAIAGDVLLGPARLSEAGIERAVSLVAEVGTNKALASPEQSIESVAEHLFQSL